MVRPVGSTWDDSSPLHRTFGGWGSTPAGVLVDDTMSHVHCFLTHFDGFKRFKPQELKMIPSDAAQF